MNEPLRRLPAVAAVLAVPALAAIGTHARRVEAVRAVLADLRQRIRDHAVAVPALADIAAAAIERVRADTQPVLRRVLNATGIVLHTNLGRAPLPEVAARAAYDAGREYLNLELSLDTGERSRRQDAIRAGLVALTGAEAATAVNNCAAATVLTLRALAAGREVIVSRGQLVEIGGGFRIPEIMAVSGATLREVGTTNITRVSDYADAIGPQTALLLRVHASNFRVRGFTAAVGIAPLVELGRQHGLPVVDDLGSGAIVDLGPIGLPDEPAAANSIAAGADLVLFSGDKLFGGPQAGIIAGRADLIARLERDPLMRAFRLDKLTLAALAATVELHRSAFPHGIPALRMLTFEPAELRTRAEAFAERLRVALPGATVTVRDEVAYAGGGSLPDTPLPSSVVALAVAGRSADELAARLRHGRPSVLGRIHNDAFYLDLRAIFPEQEDELLAAIVAGAA